MSYQLGAVALILAIAAAVSAWWNAAHKWRILILFYTISTLLMLFFMLPLSTPLWEILPLAALIQFPWRLLALASVTLAVLAGSALPDRNVVRRARLRLDARVLVLALVVVLGSYAYTLPQFTPIPGSAGEPLLSIEFELEYTDMRGMTAWTREMPPGSPLVAQYLAGEPLVTAEVLEPSASIEMIRAGGASDELWVRSENGTPLRFYTYYFPGWRVYIDGQRLPGEALRPETAYGLLTVDIPPGERHVLLRWGDTPVRLTGKILTLASLALALLLAASPWRWKKG
jgi:hypothetical protein